MAQGKYETGPASWRHNVGGCAGTLTKKGPELAASHLPQGPSTHPHWCNALLSHVEILDSFLIKAQYFHFMLGTQVILLVLTLYDCSLLTQLTHHLIGKNSSDTAIQYPAGFSLPELVC